MGFSNNVIRRLQVVVELVDCQDSTTALSRYKMNHQPLEAKHHDTMSHVRIQGVNSWFGLR